MDNKRKLRYEYPGIASSKVMLDFRWIIESKNWARLVLGHVKRPSKNFYWVKLHTPGAPSDLNLVVFSIFCFLFAFFHANESLFHKQTVAKRNTSRNTSLPKRCCSSMCSASSQATRTLTRFYIFCYTLHVIAFVLI